MSFETLTPPPKAAKATDPVRVGVRVRGDTASRLSIVVKDEVLDKIDKKKKRLFSIGLGKAEDKHLLRITADPSGLFEARAMKLGRSQKGLFNLVLPPNARWPICKVVMSGAAHEVDAKGDALLITLPSWAWDEASKRTLETDARQKPKG